MADTATQDGTIDTLTAPVRGVEAFLLDFLRTRPLPANLRDAIEYALFGPGKRMRPILTLWSCAAVGGEPEAAHPPAAAIELVHAFSLVHDDLPAMDDDDLRRGRPTLHKHTSDAMAILAGDGMSMLAVELLLARVEPADRACELVRELAVATNDMIAGQVYDTLPDWDDAVAPMDRLRTIHRHKTGALLRAACRMGAISGGASAGQLDAITRYAEAIGLMFQVVDDLLDVTESTEQLGKTAGKDVAQAKLTYPALIGIDATRREVERLRGEALDALSTLGQPAEPLRRLCDYMASRRK